MVVHLANVADSGCRGLPGLLCEKVRTRLTHAADNSRFAAPFKSMIMYRMVLSIQSVLKSISLLVLAHFAFAL